MMGFGAIRRYILMSRPAGSSHPAKAAERRYLEVSRRGAYDGFVSTVTFSPPHGAL
jgi:hypothetical protein